MSNAVECCRSRQINSKNIPVHQEARCTVCTAGFFCLFVFERFQGRKACRADGRVETGDDADEAGECQRNERQPGRDDGDIRTAGGISQNAAAVFAEVVEQRSSPVAQENAEDSADETDDARLDKKHGAHVADAAAKHFHDADFARPFVD